MDTTATQHVESHARQRSRNRSRNDPFLELSDEDVLKQAVPTDNIDNTEASCESLLSDVRAVSVIELVLDCVLTLI